MGTLTYTCSYTDQWSGTINIPYTTTYDPLTYQTTVTFLECSAVYGSRYNYNSTSSTTITVQAGDNTSSSGTATFSTSGYAGGGQQTYTGTPSPTSIIIQHTTGAGAKKVKITGSSEIKARLFSSSGSVTTVSGSGNITETITTAYSLSINTETGATATVQRTSSTITSTGTLKHGAIIYPGDKLKVSYSASTGYEITACTANGSSVSNGGTVTVSGNTTVSVSAKVLSYLLSVSALGGAIVSVTRTSSPKQSASIGTVADGATVYYSDVLVITFTAPDGYQVAAHEVNGSIFANGDSHTVTGAVSILASAVEAEVSPFSLYTLFVADGEAWVLATQNIVDTGE